MKLWLTKDPKERATVTELLKHKFINHNRSKGTLCLLLDNLQLENKTAYSEPEEQKDYQKPIVSNRKHEYKPKRAKEHMKIENYQDTILLVGSDLYGHPSFNPNNGMATTAADKVMNESTIDHSSHMAKDELYSSYSEEEFETLKVATPHFNQWQAQKNVKISNINEDVVGPNKSEAHSIPKCEYSSTSSGDYTGTIVFKNQGKFIPALSVHFLPPRSDEFKFHFEYS